MTPGAGRAIMAAVEQLTFGNGPAVAGAAAVSAAAGPAGPGYEIERELAAANAGRVAGVDEVGRGAWAGPVTVCAVIVRAGFPAPPAGLTDSKRLSPPRRAAIAGELLSWVEAFAIGEAGPAQAPRPTSSTPATRPAPAPASSRSISYPGPAGPAAADTAAALAIAGPVPNVSCSTAAMMARPAPGVTANRRVPRR